jgi:pyruvate decarboxylase
MYFEKSSSAWEDLASVLFLKSQNTIPKDSQNSSDRDITHHWRWPTVGQWLREKDIVITETGTANFGIWETRFPEGVHGDQPSPLGSIGYSIGACQGGAMAAKEEN